MSQTAGSVLDDDMLDDAIMTPGSPGSAGTASVVLGNGGGGGSSSSLLEDLERGSSRLSEAGGAAAAGGVARGGLPSDGAAGKEGEGDWGKAWEAHRRSMLREFGVEGGDSGGDKVCIYAADVLLRSWNEPTTSPSTLPNQPPSLLFVMHAR